MRRRSVCVLALVVTGVVPAGLSNAAPGVPGVTASAIETVNFYRTSAGLQPVVDDPAGNQGIADHLAYMANTPATLKAGAYASAHTENPASPWYTAAGSKAAASSNIGSGANANAAIDGWMTAPLHAIGVMRSQLTSVSFGMDSRGLAMLDVASGLPTVKTPRSLVLYPGPGSRTYLTRGAKEVPDARESCTGVGSQYLGLPIFALLTSTPPAGVSAELLRPDGRTSKAAPDLCVQTAATYRSTDPVYGATGKKILLDDNAVLIIPREPLGVGQHQVTLRLPGADNVVWSFDVIDRQNPSVVTPRLPGKVPVNAAPAGAGAVLVNLTMTQATAAGYVTADKCSRLVAGPQPQSNGNFAANQTVANMAVVPVDPDGSMCLYNSNPAHLVVDRQGAFSSTGDLTFSSITPRRVIDTRGGGKPLAGSITRISTGATGAKALLVNITMTDAAVGGYVTVARCAQMIAGPQSYSNGNFDVGATSANLAVVEVDGGGSFCVYSSESVHLLVDVQGMFVAVGGLPLTLINPSRALDTRSKGRLVAGTVTRIKSGAAGAQAVLANLTMTAGSTAGYITADKCSRMVAGPQSYSNGNFAEGQTIANLAVIPVDSDGTFCIYTSAAVHVIVDTQGSFGTTGTLRFSLTPPTRLLDTRKAS
jgi:hypothetical protein